MFFASGRSMLSQDFATSSLSRYDLSGQSIPESRSTPAPRRAPAGPTAAPPAILIVEDDRVSRKALAMLLARSGYGVEAVGSAEDALHLAGDLTGTGRMPRVALVDVDLPGMSGLDLIARLSTSHPALTPILVTASEDDRVFEAVRDGGLLYVRKPVDVGRLLALLSEIPALDRRASGAGPGNDRTH